MKTHIIIITIVAQTSLAVSERNGQCPPNTYERGQWSADRCWTDDDCSANKKCCETAFGKVCVIQTNNEKRSVEPKQGKCPPSGHVTHENPVLRCSTDLDCPELKKCCSTVRGKTCQSPATTDARNDIPKSGACPYVVGRKHPNAFNRCTTDADCKDQRKCCETVHGAACVLPAKREKASTRKPGKCPSYTPTPRTAVYRCLYDYDCADVKKCCDTNEGKSCVNPISDFSTETSTDSIKNSGAIDYSLGNFSTSQQQQQYIFCNDNANCPNQTWCMQTSNHPKKICVYKIRKSGYIRAGSCPELRSPVSATARNKCLVDVHCQQPMKCCQTEVGKQCVNPERPPENKFTTCPDGKGTARLCSTNADCPKGSLCYKGFCCESNQNKKYTDKTEKPGLCPPGPMETAASGDFQCYLDGHCSDNKKCCDTDRGKACLTPLI